MVADIGVSEGVRKESFARIILVTERCSSNQNLVIEAAILWI